ncbi:tripartite tricarboxylate transporter TctB family protein [Halomonas sp. HMF6819]|uniref:tripartite tricarboxylate transporter TctB family protein n=1 Tax=Halomonas sp. HMF6819 TaxID=3373085 RepID=UPI0037B77098
MINRVNKLAWYRTNKGLGVMLTLCVSALLVYMLLSSWAFRSQRDGFILGFVPLAAVSFMLLLSLIMIFDRSRKKSAREDSESAIVANGRALAFAMLLLAVMAFYFLVVMATGFLLATPVFLFLGAFGLGARPWGLVAFFSIFVSFLIFILLTSLGVSLPDGVFF